MGVLVGVLVGVAVLVVCGALAWWIGRLGDLDAQLVYMLLLACALVLIFGAFLWFEA